LQHISSRVIDVIEGTPIAVIGGRQAAQRVVGVINRYRPGKQGHGRWRRGTGVTGHLIETGFWPAQVQSGTAWVTKFGNALAPRPGLEPGTWRLTAISQPVQENGRMDTRSQ